MGSGASVPEEDIHKAINEASVAEIQALFQDLPKVQQASIQQVLAEFPPAQVTDAAPAERPKAGHLETKLDSCAKAGDVEGVKTALEAGVAIDDGLVYFGKTALMQAAAAGMQAVIKLLKKEGADLEVQDPYGWTAFHFAAANGRIACLNMLSELGAEKKALTKFKRNALDVVAGDLMFNQHAQDEEDPRLGVMAILRELGLDHSPQFQLFAFAKDGNLEGVRQAIEDDADVNLTDMKSATAIARAAETGQESAMKLLFEHKADLNLADENGWAPVHFAAHIGHARCVKILADLGADLKSTTKFCRNALDLVEEAILVNMEDAEQDRVRKLYKGKNRAHQNRLDSAKVLKDAGVTNSCQWKLLKHAHLGECEFVKQALKEGAEINQADVTGATAFILAAKHGRNEVLELLKELGADVQATDLRGWSAVHWASSKGEAKALKLVHEMGVPLAARTKLNRNAVDLCLEEMEHETDAKETAARMDILALFEAQKLEPSEQMRLWVYAKVGDFDQVVQALKDGADINLKNLDGRTAAQLASDNGQKDVLDKLISEGAIFEKSTL